MLTDYAINSHVSVHITGAIPPGLVGRVTDGPKAIIRNREVAWNDPAPAESYVGQTRDAVVIGYNPPYDELELSLRLVEHDPWQEVSARYRVGTEAEGRVSGLTGRGAFIELEPGVEAFLPLSGLPPVSTERIEDWLWIGDRVKAIVTRVDPSRRRLALSIRDLVERRDAQLQRDLWASQQGPTTSDVTLAELLPSDIRLRLLRLEGDDEEARPEPQLQALVIEGDETYAAALSSLLRHNGCQVTWARDGIVGLHNIAERTEPFDLILVDWSLRGPKGHVLMPRLHRESSTSRLVLVTDQAPLDEHPSVWEGLREYGVDLYLKSDGDHLRAGLVSTLAEMRADGNGRAPSRPPRFPQQAADPAQATGPAPDASEPLALPEQTETLEGILERLAQRTGADVAVLLRLDPSRRLGVEAAAGHPLSLEDAPPNLIHSPLKDVLEQHQEIHAKVPPGSSRYKRLLDIMPFEGIIGVPLHPLAAASYGLILLRETGRFGSSQLQEARWAAYLIGSILIERRLSESLVRWEAQYRVGGLVNSAIHEINNKLGAIQFLAEDLIDSLRALARWPERASDASVMQDLQSAAERIAIAQREASEVRDQYLSLTASDVPELVDLCALTEQTVRVLNIEAQKHGVLLEVQTVDDLPPVHAQSSQLRQIVMNLVLNAIQQMSGPDQRGRLTVQLSHRPGTPLPVQVRFIDGGPGIHYLLWGRIFDFGFTTRRGGAGLGLTVSRRVAADLGGRLSVEQSHMLWGTTFLLELPEGA